MHPDLRHWAAALLVAGTNWLVLAGTAQAQTQVADYQFQGVYTSTVGTIGPLTTVGTAFFDFVTETVDGVPRTVLTIGNGNGPATTDGGVQTPANPFANAAEFSIDLQSSVALNTANFVATKIFDFKGLTTDAGLYINDTTGLVQFIDGTGVPIAGATGATPVTTGTYFHLTLTRTAAGTVTVYQDGVQAFQFDDSVSGLATVSNLLTVFKDDGGGLGGMLVPESTQGSLARLQLFDGALSPEQVAALVPEPSTWAMLVGFGLVLGLAVLRRRGVV